MWCSTDFNKTQYQGFFNTTANDIIILQLDSPLRITEKVQPACLPPDEMVIPKDAPCTPGINCNGIKEEYHGLSCYYTGWNLINPANDLGLDHYSKVDKTDNILR